MAIYRNQIGTMTEAQMTFLEDVLEGLTSSPKYLSSKYFYDAEGDLLFQKIMQLPEYYLTKSEKEIFTQQTAALANALTDKFTSFDIIELGAGDATKSTHLLKHLVQNGNDLTYFPVDISENVIELLEEEMPQRIEGLKVQGLQGDYFEMIRKSYDVSNKRKVVLLLGSNVGNFEEEDIKYFLRTLHKNLLKGDLLLIGFDLKKDPEQILAAYNDAAGVTKAFNLNLLNRINNELNADFNLEAFKHFPTYDPLSGTCRSYLVSLEDQEVQIEDNTIHFEKFEAIYMEVSRKFSVEETYFLAAEIGFKPIHHFFDKKKWFLDAIWEKG